MATSFCLQRIPLCLQIIFQSPFFEVAGAREPKYSRNEADARDAANTPRIYLLWG